MELKEFCNFIKEYLNLRGENLINFSMKLQETEKDYSDTETISAWRISFIIEGKNIGNSFFVVYKDDKQNEEQDVLKSFASGFQDFIKNNIPNYRVFINIKNNIAEGKLLRLGE